MTWTYKEISLLRDNYGTLPVVAIAKVLDRSPSAVLKKASVMGLKSGLPHKVEIPLGAVQVMRHHGYSARKIGRLLGHSHKGIRYAEQHHTFAGDNE